MTVITPRGIWSGGRRQSVVDLRSNRIGLAGIKEEGWEYPAHYYFDRLARKLGDGISEEIEKLERKVGEGKVLAFLGEPGKSVVVNAREIFRSQNKSRSEIWEDRVLEVIAKRSYNLSKVEENEVKRGIKVICKDDKERVEFYVLVGRSCLEDSRFRNLIRFLMKALQMSGKWIAELLGGGERERKDLSWIKEPGYKIDVFLGEKGHYHEQLIKYRLNGHEEKIGEFDPGLYLVLSLANIPPSSIEFYPHLLNLSMGGEPEYEKEEERRELGDLSKELYKQGEGEMELVRIDRPSRGRIVLFTRPLFNESRLGYLEFEEKEETQTGGEEKEENKVWVVSEQLGTGKQSMVEEDKFILIPKGVNIQTYSLMGLLGSLSLDDLDVKDVEDIDKPGGTSSYFSKEVGKVIWGLRRRLNISWAKVVCVAAPFALEAEDENGYHFYFRERGGGASLSLVTRPGVSFALALDRSVPLIRVEHEETFVVGNNHEETVEVITNLYKRAKRILEGMYT